MAGIVMDTATFAHPNATPRTLAVSAALVEAGAPLSDISRRLYRSKPRPSSGCSGGSWTGSRAADDGRVVWSTLLDADLAATGTQPPQSEGIIDLLAQADEAEVAILFKEAGGRDADQRPDQARRRRRDRADRRVRGGGHARAAGATVDAPRRAGARTPSSPRRAGSPPRSRR